jgi:hypothetical protein
MLLDFDLVYFVFVCQKKRKTKFFWYCVKISRAPEFEKEEEDEKHNTRNPHKYFLSR